MISALGSQERYEAITGPTFRSEMCARGILRIAFDWPIRFAARVNCSVLLVAAEQDEVAPVRSVHRVGRIVGEKAKVLSLDCGHFDIYVGEWLEKSTVRQACFLQRDLAP